jgi:hypothetical protein
MNRFFDQILPDLVASQAAWSLKEFGRACISLEAKLGRFQVSRKMGSALSEHMAL